MEWGGSRRSWNLKWIYSLDRWIFIIFVFCFVVIDLGLTEVINHWATPTSTTCFLFLFFSCRWTHAFIFMWSWGWNPVPHMCQASAVHCFEAVSLSCWCWPWTCDPPASVSQLDRNKYVPLHQAQTYTRLRPTSLVVHINFYSAESAVAG